MLFEAFKATLIYRNRAYELRLPWEANEEQILSETEKLRQQMRSYGEDLPVLKIKTIDSDPVNKRLLVRAETDE